MSRPEDDSFRGWRFESFEERLALSVQPVADFWYDETQESIIEPSSSLIQPLGTTEGHGWTDLAAARDQYGLRGAGQTVAIIDSGIAYDHVALGGGLGSSHKVVGGWDFAENDANPYDDAPAGFHGTHVAGIVGSQDGRYSGVAPNVDLVALRVFDDQGNGYFNWVNQALAWVHQHRNDYESPITTVNLSLGTDWNSNSLPQWATLESGLKQLADDGIFVSVAAGNSFQSYNSAGLSYPAVSPHVTPVASVDAGGNLSRFSQRNNRVLAAPGERIMSTVPDAFYGGDGIKNDWGAASGTSMASPYVAGASVLVREAMQNLDQTQISQGSINDLFHRTADKVYDAATQASYDRINVSRALATLVGPDDFGSVASGASAIGQIASTLRVSGTIGSATDKDFFQFVAARTGKVTMTLTDGQYFDAAWQPTAGGQVSGNKLTLDVVAGQSYVVGVAGGATSIGKYTIDMQLGSASPPSNSVGAVTINGTLATVTGTAANDVIRWQAGGQLTVNGVSHSLAGVTQVTIEGGGGNDSLTLVGGGAAESVVLRPGSVDLTSTSFRLNASNVENIQFSGDRLDQASFFDSASNDLFEATPQWARLSGGGFVNYVTGAGSVLATSQAGGSDVARLYDSLGNDTLKAGPSAAALEGNGFANAARGFSQVFVMATAGGYDVATLNDSAGTDLLDASSKYVWLRGNGFSIRAEGFDNLTVNATNGGNDFARLIGSDGDDVLGIWRNNRNLYSGGAEIRTFNFRLVQFDGGGGYDWIDYYSASKNCYLYGRSQYGALLDQVFETHFSSVESLVAHVNANHKLKSDLAALEWVFQKWK
jgi:subtilisin family serine protease